ncbi:hypothetical protein V5O48_013337, partial [Marasmius crinis-equi]
MSTIDLETELASDLEPEVFEPLEDCNQKQWSAINEQIAREIQADLSQILPRLHGINSRMGDMRGDYSSLHDNPQFSEFK